MKPAEIRAMDDEKLHQQVADLLAEWRTPFPRGGRPVDRDGTDSPDPQRHRAYQDDSDRARNRSRLATLSGGGTANAEGTARNDDE